MAQTLAPLIALLSEREVGQDARSTNVHAAQALANILKSSLGPWGLDKLLVDNVGDYTVTNDGATILKQLEVSHPAARVLVDLSQLQDQEVGDGTTSVVLIAAELLKRANALVKQGVHPTTIISGYKLAMKEAIKYIKSHMLIDISTLDKSRLLSLADTTLNSKFIGADSSHFGPIVVDAIMHVKIALENNAFKYPVKAINILKSHGRSASESFLFDGYALARLSRASNAMPKRIQKPKIALLDFNLRQHRMQLGVQIEITNPIELEHVRERERDITKSKIETILKAGANVILTTQGIDDMALKYFVEANCIAVRRVDRQDLKRLAQCTGGTVSLTLADMNGEEKFDPAWLGECAEVYEDRVGDWDFLFFHKCRNTKAQTIVLRGANEQLLDEMERSVHDALCAVSRALENRYVSPGGGAVEVSLSTYLENLARTIGSREQLAIAEFAEALLVIPKTLATNAALDSFEMLAKLKKVHHSYQKSQNEDEMRVGLNLIQGTIGDNLSAGILEPTISKIKMIRFATEAAITILRIDDIIKIQKEPEPQRGQPGHM